MDLFKYTYDLVRQIPPGRVSTYGAVAQALGDPTAARAVGRMMNQNPDPDSMPCYKIVHSDGKIGGFGLGIDDKIRRLQNDNILIKDGGIVDFKNVLFTDFETTYPLCGLRKKQISVCRNVVEDDAFEDLETIAGVDVAYPKNAFKQACAACVVIDVESKQVIEKKHAFAVPSFPYIPTYLCFREYPLIEQVFRTLDQKPSVLFVDGNGMLHPQKSGLACYTGVLLDIPTVGVAKSHLTGEVKDDGVYVNDELVGYTVFPTRRVTRPLYVSTGHRVHGRTAVDLVQKMCTTKHPEPLRRAHIVANKRLREIRKVFA